MVNRIPTAHSFAYDGVTHQVYHANKGEGLPKHEHVFSHSTICHAGSCIIRKENIEKTITKESGPVNLLGGEWHEIEALQNNTVFVNIFATTKQI